MGRLLGPRWAVYGAVEGSRLNTLAGGQAPRTWYCDLIAPRSHHVSIPSLVGRLLGLDYPKLSSSAIRVSIPSLVGRLLGPEGCQRQSKRVLVSIPSLVGRLLGPHGTVGKWDLVESLNTLAGGQAPRTSAIGSICRVSLRVSIPSLVGRLLGPWEISIHTGTV